MAANVSKVFSLGVVVAAGTQINQIISHSINPGLEPLVLSSDGQVDPRYAAIMRQSPMINFATTAIVRGLTAAGVAGLALTGTALDAWLQKYAQGGTRLTSTNSTKLSIAYGMLCPRTLEASDGSFATLSYDVWGRTNDGTTSPLAITAGASMPSITAPDQLFTVGPVVINGTLLEGVKRISVDFGLQLSMIGGSGGAFPEFIAIQKRAPSITIRSTHADFAAESGMGMYVAQTATDSVAYFRKIAQNGSATFRVADGTSEHVSFSMDDGLVTINDISASNDDGDGAAIELTWNPVYDGTNAILAMSLATAITLP
jgi:hypothetical protein